MEKIEIKRTPYLVWMGRISILILIAHLVYTVISWLHLPQQIPMHWGFDGTIDAWGSRNTIWITTVVQVGMYLLFTGVLRKPGIWNTGVTITEENRERVYQTLANMLVTLRLAVQGLFVYLTWCTVQQEKVGAIIYIVVFLPFLWLLRLRKNKDKS